ncbi:MAG: hypothetical protein KJO07_01370 [Deltaproteobacteria bacterium]|jgi:hypothetical protein|nr:hypothetical protein [Deltaproteobacteria bacterium]
MRHAIAIATLLVSTTVVGAGDASAQSDRGLVPRPGEFRRSGLALGIGAGTAFAFELGDLVDVNGFGGGPSFRVGTTASERLLWMLQLDGAAYLFDAGEETGVNQLAVLAVAGQVYVLDAFWLKAGLGVANYRQQVRRQIKLDPTDEFPGVGILTGLGLDVYQEGAIAIGLEMTVSTAVLADGVILQGWTGVGFHIY